MEQTLVLDAPTPAPQNRKKSCCCGKLAKPATPLSSPREAQLTPVSGPSLELHFLESDMGDELVPLPQNNFVPSLCYCPQNWGQASAEAGVISNSVLSSLLFHTGSVSALTIDLSLLTPDPPCPPRKRAHKTHNLEHVEQHDHASRNQFQSPLTSEIPGYSQRHERVCSSEGHSHLGSFHFWYQLELGFQYPYYYYPSEASS